MNKKIASRRRSHKWYDYGIISQEKATKIVELTDPEIMFIPF